MQSAVPVYIVAVSGGIDSVVMLDLLVNSNDLNAKLIVAHFDHGIRTESAEDAKFVERLAIKHGLSFELGSAMLGPEASEAQAREVRYNFLRQCCKKYKASGIITAHHQDDLIETAIINLLRGTSWRGLNSLKEFSSIDGYDVIRPLHGASKSQIQDYAKANNLNWVEDSTNLDPNYLRNYVRLSLIPAAVKKDANFKAKFINIIKNGQILHRQIDNHIMQLIEKSKSETLKPGEFNRYNFIMWPENVASEVIYTLLRDLDINWHPSKLQITKALHFIKTGLPDKQLELGNGLKLELSTRTVQFKKS